MDRLSGDFNRGYTKAIMDLIEVIKYIESDLIYHKKRLNYKILIRLMEVCLTNRENIRDNRNGFIRWNSIINDFEWFKKEE